MQDTRVIHIGTDHAGFELKEELVPMLQSLGYEVVDHGAYEFDEEDDYPDFISPVAQAVSADMDKLSRGIVIGGSGQGEAIVSNKFPNIRAVVWYGNPEGGDGQSIITLSREHNDANILSIGARFVSIQEAKEAVELWLETAFSGDERHIRRINKIEG
jgi:ribose 5-phosphate isomerase B